MRDIGKIDFLRRWNEQRGEGIELNEIPQLPAILNFGGLDLAERIDHSCLFGLTWDGQHLDQHGVKEWEPPMRYPQIAEDVRMINEKVEFLKIGFDETGNTALGYLFSQDLEDIMEPIHFTNPMKLDTIRVISYLKDLGILRLEANDPVIRQMDEQQKVISPAGFQRYEHPSGTHDDRFWALGLACYVAVDYIVGIPPVAIETAGDAQEMGEDPDVIIENIMAQYTNKFPY